MTVKNAGTVQIAVALESLETLVLTLNVAFPPASLSKTSLSLQAGNSASLTINNLSGRTVRWSSSKASVATVQDGKVKAVKPGKCVITARLSNGMALKCNLTVVKK